MGGAIGAESAVGRGSAFWFELGSSADAPRVTRAAVHPANVMPVMLGLHAPGDADDRAGHVGSIRTEQPGDRGGDL
jgi:hypothetical protein